jgi:hypothetical protein
MAYLITDGNLFWCESPVFKWGDRAMAERYPTLAKAEISRRVIFGWSNTRIVRS